MILKKGDKVKGNGTSQFTEEALAKHGLTGKVLTVLEVGETLITLEELFLDYPHHSLKRDSFSEIPTRDFKRDALRHALGVVADAGLVLSPSMSHDEVVDKVYPDMSKEIERVENLILLQKKSIIMKQKALTRRCDILGELEQELEDLIHDN